MGGSYTCRVRDSRPATRSMGGQPRAQGPMRAQSAVRTLHTCGNRRSYVTASQYYVEIRISSASRGKRRAGGIIVLRHCLQTSNAARGRRCSSLTYSQIAQPSCCELRAAATRCSTQNSWGSQWGWRWPLKKEHFIRRCPFLFLLLNCGQRRRPPPTHTRRF